MHFSLPFAAKLPEVARRKDLDNLAHGTAAAADTVKRAKLSQRCKAQDCKAAVRSLSVMLVSRVFPRAEKRCETWPHYTVVMPQNGFESTNIYARLLVSLAEITL